MDIRRIGLARETEGGIFLSALVDAVQFAFLLLARQFECKLHKAIKITKDMLDLAKHIVEQKSGHFEPEKFEDHHEAALAELLAKKQKGLPIAAAKKSAPDNVVNLMDALRASLKSSGKTTAPAGRPAKTPAKKAAKKRKAG